jgi:adenylate cyclase
VRPEEDTRLASASAVDPEVYEIYLMSRRLGWGPDADEIKRSIAYAQEVIEKAPDFAPGYAALADAYSVAALSGVAPEGHVLPMAREAALRALELDEGLAEPHASLALIKWYIDWDWTGAEAEYRRALQLKPSDVTTRALYGAFLQCIGRLEEGVAETFRAYELDPLSPQREQDLAGRLLAARRFDEAIVHAKRALEVDPGSQNAAMTLAAAYWAKGLPDEHIRVWLTWQPPEDLAPVMAGVRKAYAAGGPRAVLEFNVRNFERGWEQGENGQPVLIADLHTRLSHHDEAFEWLERAYDRRHPLLVHILADPDLDPLHRDPRFQDLLRRMGLPATEAS